MQILRSLPRLPRPLAGRPLIEFHSPQSRDPFTLARREPTRLLRDAQERPKQVIRRFEIEPGQSYQAAEIRQVMDPQSLLP